MGTERLIDTIWWLDEIYFSMQPQQQPNWCWAATATSVGLFYQPGSGWQQCDVANGELALSHRRGEGAVWLECLRLSRPGTHGGGPLGPLGGRHSHYCPDRGRGNFRPSAGDSGSLVGGGGAHFLVIKGQYSAGGIDYVSVDDPIYGRSDVNYATLQTAYKGSGTWTHTYYTKY